MNPILRSDIRLRTSSPKAIMVHTLFLSLLAVLAFLSLPPEFGRLDEVRQQGLLLTFLIVETALIAYFTSACACGEVSIEGEKFVWDLAASPFASAAIATGKVTAAGAFASILLILATPFMAVVAGIRGEPLSGVVRAAVVALPFATAVGALGTLYGAIFDSEFARSFVHWVTLLAVIVGAAALPAPWDLISPVRTLAIAVREGLRPEVVFLSLGYILVAVVSGWGIRLRVEAIRRQAHTP